jgi:hypothetical protein
MAVTRTIAVPSPEALQAAVGSHLAQGYVIQAASANDVYLFKAKRFEPVWAVIGLALCVIPLLVYLVIYLLQQDQAVHVIVQRPPPPPRPPPQPAATTEPYWDGNRWITPDG